MIGNAAMCDGKKRFTSYSEAVKSSARLNLHRQKAHSTAYKCPHCRGYHVGNTTHEREKRMIRSKYKQELRSGRISVSN